MAKRKQWDDGWAVNGFRAEGWDNGEFDGTKYGSTNLNTPHGTASLSWEDGAKGVGRIRFCYGGRIYVRNYEPAPTKAGLIRMASAFVREVVG